MAMSLDIASDSDPMSQINTTPLVDVMLVLLIMFIVTLPAMTNSINMHLTGGPSLEKPDVIDLSIDFDGTILWNGAAVQSLGQLEQYFRAAAAQKVQPEVHVLPHRRAKYDTVAQVLGMAQRSGIARIGFAGQERFAD